MAKPIITANEVREARKAGWTAIVVPSGAIVTPQARDDARAFGIRFASEASRPVALSYAASPVPAPAVSPKPAVSGGGVPGQITLYAGRAFEDAATGLQPMPDAGKIGNTLHARDCKLGVCMLFLTEEDIRQRAIERGGELTLSVSERLTPSAMEYIRAQRIRVVEGDAVQGAAVPAPAVQGKAAESGVKTEINNQGLTHLDAASMVAKTHPRIEARGKLDSLMAAAVLVQTQFDPKGKLPGMLKDCLTEVKEWIFQSLAAEVSGSILPPQSMGGMNMDVLRAVSRNPRQYLHTDHLMPDAALGTNIALLNWLRAQVRETELAVAKAALCRTDIQESLNRLSSAVYVLMLLTHLAENGVAIPKLQ